MSTVRDSLEGCDIKLKHKIQLIEKALSELIARTQTIFTRRLCEYQREIEELSRRYDVSVVNSLTIYYKDPSKEAIAMLNYYRIITRENFVGQLDDIAQSVNYICEHVRVSDAAPVISQPAPSDITSIDMRAYKLCVGGSAIFYTKAAAHIQASREIEIGASLEKKDFELCACGARMRLVQEVSELHCDICKLVRRVDGVAFRDRQYKPRDTHTTKNSCYEPTKHLKFWLDRLQAIKITTFKPEQLNKIARAIEREQISRRHLTCEIMRSLLKDSKVNETRLNEHTPALVKHFGGVPPPLLDFDDIRRMHVLFDKIIRIYAEINPESGNNPYFPYFILKIAEHLFKENPEKLRIINYIHLQSHDTIRKNDIYFKVICARLGPSEGIKYRPTNSSGAM